MTENERLTMTDAEMDEIRQYAPDFDCPVKAYEGSVTNLFCESVCDEFQNHCPFMEMSKRLKCYEDIGAINEFITLKEKEIPKKPIYSKKYGYHCYDCPVCGTSVTIEMEHGCEPDYRLKRCEECGQVINWCEIN